MGYVLRPPRELFGEGVSTSRRYLVSPYPNLRRVTAKHRIRSEYLSDDDDSPWDKRTPKGCDHWVINTRYNPDTLVTRYPITPTSPKVTEVDNLYFYHDVRPSVESVLNSLDVVLAPSDWDRVVRNSLPSLRNDFNLINFLLELDDIPRLIDRFRGIDEAILRWNFGAVPLWADIGSFFEQLNIIMNRLDEINHRLKHGVGASAAAYRSFRREIPTVTVATAHGVVEDCLLMIWGQVQVTWTCKVFGSYSGSRLQHFADLLGLYPDLGTLWNAVPFSFIVDYFISIGDALEGGSWAKMDIEPRYACRSIKVTGQYLLRPRSTSYRTGDRWVTHSQPVFCSGDFTYYRREPSKAQLDGVDLDYQVGMPNFDQQVNLAALLSAFSRRR